MKGSFEAHTESDGHLRGPLVEVLRGQGQEKSLPQEAQVWAGMPAADTKLDVLTVHARGGSKKVPGLEAGHGELLLGFQVSYAQNKDC